MKKLMIAALASLILIGCEKDFDEKYEDNLQQLQQKADAIEADVDQRLQERAQAEKILRPNNISDNKADDKADDISDNAPDGALANQSSK